MIANRELYLSVIDNGGCGKQSYSLNENITVLMNDGSIAIGTIQQIEEEYLIMSNNKDEIVISMYKNMKKIARTDWLGGEDIREN